MGGALTVCCSKYVELCRSFFNGGYELLPEKVKSCVQLTAQRCIQYYEMKEQCW